MRKAERIERIREKAYDYARSGKYKDWYIIEFTLRQQGYHEARSELDSRHIREDLDQICKVAQAAKQRGLTYEQALQEMQGGGS